MQKLTNLLRYFGSSPRVRGTYPWGKKRSDDSRFIPACAGNMSAPAIPAAIIVANASVHPRVCGEHVAAVNMAINAIGSSPRVRGTFYSIDLKHRNTRFIPACAGNIQFGKGKGWVYPVHPRVCGEHRSGFPAMESPCGSSPRVRGTSMEGSESHEPLRFIPACAGNISTAFLRGYVQPVHPRVCGEHWIHTGAAEWIRGSSPRVRGTCPERIHQCQYLRFIPACAGNISPKYQKTGPSAVHPRVCGEHE